MHCRMMLEREGQQESNFRGLTTFTSSSVLDSFMRRLKDFDSSRNKAKYGFGDFQIGNPIGRTDKRIVWVDGGMHAREWAAIHTALFFIDQLISQYGIDPQITSYVDTLNFYIVPAANPDGYEYSRSDITPRKLAQARTSAQKYTKAVGLSVNPKRVDAYITLHTYSQMWIHPYNHQRHSFPSDVNDLVRIHLRKLIWKMTKNLSDPSAGGSDDWAKAKAGVKFVYLLELRPGEEEWDGFLLDRRQLIPTGRETWAGVRVVIDAIMKSQSSLLLLLTFQIYTLSHLTPDFFVT
ncbi:unnamed protein product [Gongylonema pulchrum]|uniref:Peptidase_M14 domain-containing protein n=1 Tax=Gongylonema pulchrum TaxID=637853 RepID=A0A183E7T9_9BILA|nr:unnamed protein product [Gongylonema pulchrum]